MAKAKKRKINPNRKNVTEADLKRAKNEALNEAVGIVWAIFFTVMRDKEGWGAKRLCRLWDNVNELSDSIAKGYVSVTDLKKALEDEAGFTLH